MDALQGVATDEDSEAVVPHLPPVSTVQKPQNKVSPTTTETTGQLRATLGVLLLLTHFRWMGHLKCTYPYSIKSLPTTFLRMVSNLQRYTAFYLARVEKSTTGASH